MKTESPHTDSAGRRIREGDLIEAKYGYRYTVCFDQAQGWSALDGSGHYRMALSKVAAFCTVVDGSEEEA